MISSITSFLGGTPINFIDFPFYHLPLICGRTAKEKANFPWSRQNKRAANSV